MKLVIPFLGAWFFLLLEANVALVYAANTGDDINGNDSTSVMRNGGFVEVGLVASYEQGIRRGYSPELDDEQQGGIGISISAGFRYDRVFLELSDSGFNGLNLGVTLLDSDRWGVDFLLANVSGDLNFIIEDSSINSSSFEELSEEERSQFISQKPRHVTSAGIRVTGFFGDNIAQLRLLSDQYGGSNGFLGSARFGKRWQLGNVNLQAVVGIRYNSSEINNHIYGVSSVEYSQRFPHYSPDHAWIPEVEFGLSQPVLENWIYATRFRYREYPSSVTDSPLVANGQEFLLTTGIHYVF